MRIFIFISIIMLSVSGQAENKKQDISSITSKVREQIDFNCNCEALKLLSTIKEDLLDDNQKKECREFKIKILNNLGRYSEIAAIYDAEQTGSKLSAEEKAKIRYERLKVLQLAGKHGLEVNKDILKTVYEDAIKLLEDSNLTADLRTEVSAIAMKCIRIVHFKDNKKILEMFLQIESRYGNTKRSYTYRRELIEANMGVFDYSKALNLAEEVENDKSITAGERKGLDNLLFQLYLENKKVKKASAKLSSMDIDPKVKESLKELIKPFEK